MSEVEQMAAVLAEHLWHHTKTTHCACGWRAELAQLAVDGYTAHVAAELARAGFGAVGDGCCDHDAEAHNLGHEVDRVRERLWRLAALAGWRPGNPADNDATAELYVTEGLACAEAAMASAKAEALREAADEMVGTHGTSPHARFLRDRADQIARTDESERA